MSTPIEEIKERLNIIEVVQEYLPLTKAGTNFKARCPFHNEQTPSFMVSEPKQFFHCFGCGKGGDIFTFVQEIEGVEFSEALRMLARKANVTLDRLSPVDKRQKTEKAEILDCLQVSAEYYQNKLWQSPSSQICREYLKKRLITEVTAKAFNLGYSDDAWDDLYNYLNKQGFSSALMEKAGLTVRSPKTGGWYDRFRGRLMFPIYNHYANVIGFGGRTLDPDQKEAKYINSPQTAVYNKSYVVYGLHLAKQHIHSADATVVVEGYLDVISAYQAKFRNVVAASGTALTIEQVRLLKRYSPNVIFAFDADAAGFSAVWRGMQTAIQEGMNIKILTLPTGQDPDEVINEDPQKFKELAKAAKPFMDYSFHTVLSPLDLKNVHHKKKAAAELLPMIALFPDTIEQTHYLQILAERLQVSATILEDKLKEFIRRQRPSYSTPRTLAEKKINSKKSTNKPREEQLSDLLVALMILNPKEFPSVLEKLNEDALVGMAKTLYKMFSSYYNAAGILDPQKIELTDPLVATKFRELDLLSQHLFADTDAVHIQQEIFIILHQLQQLWLLNQLRQTQREIAAAEISGDSTKLNELLAQHQRLLDERLNLEKNG